MADIRLSLDELTQNDTVDSCVPDLPQSTVSNDVSTQPSNNTAIEDDTQELEEALKDAVDLVINAFMKNDKLSQSVASIPGFDRHSLVGKVEILLKVSKLIKNYEKVEATMKSLQDRLSKSKSQITRLESSKEDLKARLEHLSQSVGLEDILSQLRQIFKHSGVAAGPLFRVKCEDAEADVQEQAMEIVDETDRSEDVDLDDTLYNIVQHQDEHEEGTFDDTDVELADYSDDDFDVEIVKANLAATETMKVDGTTTAYSLRPNRRRLNVKGGKGKSGFGASYNECHFCGKVFEKPSHLENHVRIHTGEKPFVCDVCGESFRLQNYLTEHRRIHTGERPHVCTVCGKSFRKSSALSEHKRVHTKPYQCNICSTKFVSRSRLKRHSIIHTAREPIPCEYCGKLVCSQKSLINHMLLIHQLDRNGQPCSPKQKENVNCSICNKVIRKHGLKEHMAIHLNDRKHQCEFCDKSFVQKQALVYHVKRVHEKIKPFACTLCESRFVRQGDLNSHMKKHEEGYYISQTCKICGKVLCNEDSYRHHLATHAPEKTVPCDQCDMMFYTERSRKDHVKRVHEGRVYQCEVCGRKLVSSKGLKNHMMIHTGEKPFGCEVCGMYFRKLDTLKSHAKTHGSQAKYHCGLCGEKFISQSQFGGHRAKCDSTIFVMDDSGELEEEDSNDV